VHSYGVRLAALASAFEHGQWLGRWCDTLDRGYGYPLFTFYAPGFYLLGLVFYKIGFGLTLSWKSALVLLQLAGAGGMYGTARQFYGRSGAAVSALLWAFLPYQQVNLFVRGAMGEFAALQWLPVAAFLGLWGIRSRRTLPVILAAVAHGALIVTHAITAMTATAALLALFLGAEWHWRRRISWRPLLTIGLAVGLSAFYWMPALLERSWVRTEALTSGPWVYSNHFLTWPQWLNVFSWGHGPSASGNRSEMALHVGLGSLAFLIAGWWLVSAREGCDRKQRWPLVAGTTLAAAVLFFTLAISDPVWRRIPLLSYVQFPWRLLGLAGFFLAWVGGCAIDTAMARGLVASPRRKLALGAALCFIVLSPPWHRGGIREEPPLIAERPSDEDLMSRHWAMTAEDEFLPRWVEEKWPKEFPAQEARAIPPAGDVAVSRNPGGGWDISVGLTKRSRIVFGQYYSPGWRLEHDGQPAGTLAQDSCGLVAFSAPAGQSRFTLSRARTSAQEAGDWISIAALLFCIGIAALWLLPGRGRLSRS